ncbi:hypothetical protein B0H11DRAFT_1910119 [Mycena galericulata]|nr:hypothetical protein B0H11DRAFT_1910119 [Mycena galericulata]
MGSGTHNAGPEIRIKYELAAARPGQIRITLRRLKADGIGCRVQTPRRPGSNSDKNFPIKGADKKPEISRFRGQAFCVIVKGPIGRWISGMTKIKMTKTEDHMDPQRPTVAHALENREDGHIPERPQRVDQKAAISVGQSDIVYKRTEESSMSSQLNPTVNLYSNFELKCYLGIKESCRRRHCPATSEDLSPLLQQPEIRSFRGNDGDSAKLRSRQQSFTVVAQTILWVAIGKSRHLRLSQLFQDSSCYKS